MSFLLFGILKEKKSRFRHFQTYTFRQSTFRHVHLCMYMQAYIWFSISLFPFILICYFWSILLVFPQISILFVHYFFFIIQDVHDHNFFLSAHFTVLYYCVHKLFCFSFIFRICTFNFSFEASNFCKHISSFINSQSLSQGISEFLFLVFHLSENTRYKFLFQIL